MAVKMASTPLTPVQLQSNSGQERKEPKTNSPFSLTKPSWLIRTESNVRKQVRKKPDPPCVVCLGTGRVDCYYCSGKGRTNHVDLAMLPKGEWPKWCRTCGGSGLSYCFRCLGTGEYRYIMGFHSMKMNSPSIQSPQEHQNQGNPGPYSAADRLLNGEQFKSDHVYKNKGDSSAAGENLDI